MVLAVKNWSRLISYFRPDAPRIGAALGLMALSIAASVLKPWPVAIIIDSILGAKPFPEFLPQSLQTIEKPVLLALCALLIFVLHAAQGIFSAGQNFLSIQAGLEGLARIRNELFDWMQRLSLAFYQRSNQGDLIYRATWDTYSLQTIFQQGLFKFLNAFATVALMVVVMWQVNTPLTLITLAIFPPLLVTMYVFGRQMNRRSLAAHQADSQVASLVQQNITSLAVVQSYTRESDESTSFGRQVRASVGARTEQHRIEVLYWLAIAVLFGLGTAGLTWWGAREILLDRLTVGELVIFLSYLGQLYEPLNQLSHVGATVSDANAGTHRIFEILDTREQVSEKPGAAPLNPLPGVKGLSIEFRNISFGYDARHPVLENLSFRIDPGESVGIIGPSGAGKTTLLNLIPRFYDSAAGVIEVDGKDHREWALRSLRENVACVFQESFLLPATIAENIAYGRPEASLKEIEHAAEMANAASFIARLPKGYDTVVGEGATRLSVGEKQRISIARAFLKRAPILILDEPTSSLDAASEEAIVESLGLLMRNSTTLMAAHRLSTLRQVQKIMVLEKGRLTEFGTPEALRRSGGYFNRLMGQTT